MSCPNATAPINIVKTIADECDLKCDYSHNYPTTSVIADNKGDYIRLAFDPEKEAPTSFNKVKYSCQEARIYQPSLHTFAGKHAPAEIVIVHQSDTTAQTLLVCIPIILDANSKGGLVDALITQIASGAASLGTRTGVTLPGFSLNRVVPAKPYYSYTGTYPYSPCNGKVDYVVFADTYGVPISAGTLAKIAGPGTAIITAQSYATHNNPDGYYFNNKGPSPFTSVGDDIYIECQPTGADGNVLVPEGGSSSSGGDMNIGDKIKSLLASPWIAGLFGVILIYIILRAFDALSDKLFSAGKQSGGTNVTNHLSAASKT